MEPITIEKIFIFNPILKSPKKKASDDEKQDAKLLYYYPKEEELLIKRSNLGIIEGTINFMESFEKTNHKFIYTELNNILFVANCYEENFILCFIIKKYIKFSPYENINTKKEWIKMALDNFYNMFCFYHNSFSDFFLKEKNSDISFPLSDDKINVIKDFIITFLEYYDNIKLPFVTNMQYLKVSHNLQITILFSMHKLKENIPDISLLTSVYKGKIIYNEVPFDSISLLYNLFYQILDSTAKINSFKPPVNVKKDEIKKEEKKENIEDKKEEENNIEGNNIEEKKEEENNIEGNNREEKKEEENIEEKKEEKNIEDKKEEENTEEKKEEENTEEKKEEENIEEKKEEENIEEKKEENNAEDKKEENIEEKKEEENTEEKKEEENIEDKKEENKIEDKKEENNNIEEKKEDNNIEDKKKENIKTDSKNEKEENINEIILTNVSPFRKIFSVTTLQEGYLLGKSPDINPKIFIPTIYIKSLEESEYKLLIYYYKGITIFMFLKKETNINSIQYDKIKEVIKKIFSNEIINELEKSHKIINENYNIFSVNSADKSLKASGIFTKNNRDLNYFFQRILFVNNDVYLNSLTYFKGGINFKGGYIYYLNSLGRKVIFILNDSLSFNQLKSEIEKNEKECDFIFLI